MLVIPTSNPKHAARKKQLIRQDQLAEPKISKRLIFMLILAIVIIVSAILIVLNFKDDSTDPETTVRKIEDGDMAIIEYKIWEDSNENGEVEWTDVESEVVEHRTIYPNISLSNLIKGFYDNVLNLREGNTKIFIVDANVDANADGIDDITGKEVTGWTSGKYANVKIQYWVNILNITKKGEEPLDFTPTSANLNFNLEKSSLPSLNYVFSVFLTDFDKIYTKIFQFF